jgi:hypothetical protein
MVAGAQDGMDPIESDQRRTSRTRLALVARFGNVVEIIATRPLQQIATRSGLVAQLRACTSQQRSAEHPVMLPHPRIGREVAVSHHRTDPQAALGGVFNLIERQAADVHQVQRSLDLQFHQIKQIGSTCDDLGARFGRRSGGVRR